MKAQRCLTDSLPSVLVSHTWTNMQREFQNTDFCLTQDLKYLTTCPLIYNARLLVSLLSLQKHLQHHHSKLTNEKRSDLNQMRNHSMTHSPHQKNASQYIANSYSPPIHALRDPQGRFVTTPDGIDALL